MYVMYTYEIQYIDITIYKILLFTVGWNVTVEMRKQLRELKASD